MVHCIKKIKTCAAIGKPNTSGSSVEHLMANFWVLKITTRVRG